MVRRVFRQAAIAAPLYGIALPPSFEKEVIERMAVGQIPGAVVGTVRNGKTDWVKPLGVLGGSDRNPVDANSVFHAASLTKQVVAYAAFALRAAGNLDFDRTLVSYVDDLQDPLARKVTVRHVLSHSSGFPNWRFEEGKPLVPAFEPGSRFQYSGEGYFYLQRVLEEVSGRGIGELLQQLVFTPLGMSSTSLTWNPDWLARTALPHDRNGEPRKNWDRPARILAEAATKRGQTVEAWKYKEYSAAVRELGGGSLPNFMLPNGAASMVTTASDYSRFLAAAIGNPEIAKPQISIRPQLAWGLGWGIEQWNSRTFLWQWGDNGGFKNIVIAEPSRREAIFVFTNADKGARLCEWVVRRIHRLDHPLFLWL